MVSNRAGTVNPVVESAEFAFKETNLVQIDSEGITTAAKFIYEQILNSSYTPRTWRTLPLYICPSEPYQSNDETRRVIDYIFLISSLNFSFWSDKTEERRYAVEWWNSWTSRTCKKTYTGYWSLVAALDRALDEGISITDPSFYGNTERCPDDLIRCIFRTASPDRETMPLLDERIKIMRENGAILKTRFRGSFSYFIESLQKQSQGHGTALDLVKMVIEHFPSFRDEVDFRGRKIFIWKRVQILVAELWAAFYPPGTIPPTPHPLFPGPKGPRIDQLTMFADYRVPQILSRLHIITYPPELLKLLERGTMLPNGSREEISLRSASIVGVERVRQQILALQGENTTKVPISSVLIDFYLWDLAKRIESGQETIKGLKDDVPVHRTRSIWY